MPRALCPREQPATEGPGDGASVAATASAWTGVDRKVRVRAVLERSGEIAALATAGCWVVSAVAFESAGKRIGSLSLNLIRLVFALLPLSLWGLWTRGQALPLDADGHNWSWLSVSALVGFVFGDLCLFRAFVLVGPRLSTVIMASAPVWAGLLGFAFLGETLDGRELLGMALTVAGVTWAVSERRPEASGSNPAADEATPELSPPRRRWWRWLTGGVVMAFAGAIGQAGGLVLSKHGMAGYDPFAATQIRVFAAIAGFALVITAAGWWPRVVAALRDRSAMGSTAIGACFGPFLGVGLSLVAVETADTGVAASLMATAPILMLPVAWWRGDRPGRAGIFGAVIAVAGVVLLLA